MTVVALDSSYFAVEEIIFKFFTHSLNYSNKFKLKVREIIFLVIRFPI